LIKFNIGILSVLEFGLNDVGLLLVVFLFGFDGLVEAFTHDLEILMAFFVGEIELLCEHLDLGLVSLEHHFVLLELGLVLA
jgi:hypothetical protein